MTSAEHARLFSCVTRIAFSTLLLQASSATAATPSHASPEALRVADFPAPPSGVLGLYPFIEPRNHRSDISIYYPKNAGNEFEDQVSYFFSTFIYFHCAQPTRRVAVHGNSNWIFAAAPRVRVNRDGGTWMQLDVSATFFNSADETIVIDMVDMMGANASWTYELYFWSRQQPIDIDDRYGLQAFTQTLEDSNDVIVTASLSGAPKTMRRFIPCFDDPSYRIPYSGNVNVHYGAAYSIALAMMNGPPFSVNHYCPSDSNFRYSRYWFDHPNMAIEFMHLRIAPLAWYLDPDIPSKCT